MLVDKKDEKLAASTADWMEESLAGNLVANSAEMKVDMLVAAKAVMKVG